MSDLQCAARFLLVGGAVDTGPLRRERVARVYDATPGRLAGEAGRVAGELGVQAATTPSPVDPRDVAALAPAALAVLRELADLHRGETVLLLAEGQGSPFLALVDGDGVLLEPFPAGSAGRA